MVKLIYKASDWSEGWWFPILIFQHLWTRTMAFESIKTNVRWSTVRFNVFESLVAHASQTLINQCFSFLSIFLCLKAIMKKYNRLEVTSRRHFKDKDTLFEVCQTWHASQAFTEQNMGNNMKKSINLFSSNASTRIEESRGLLIINAFDNRLCYCSDQWAFFLQLSPWFDMQS